jgi:galactonate dehydratase
MSGLSARLFSVRVTPATTWLFVALGDGVVTGWGEATQNGREQAIAEYFRSLPDRLDPAVLAALRFDTLPRAALSSAILQANADLAARQAEKSLSDHLGGTARRSIGVYANVNRRTRDRSPESMAASARDALDQGHTAIKIAPFDEVRPTQSRSEMTQAMELGLDRIAAVRDAIGARRLMVDCHWRFDVAGAEALIDACAPFGLHWIECPIAETEATIPDLVALRARANALGIRLAGLETAIRREGFAPYLAAGAYDVMMPDVKYCGGPDEMMAIAADLARHGVAFSPHNPSGPICHLHSLSVCATLPESDLLETQFDETPMFESLVGGDLPVAVDGHMSLREAVAGLGVTIDLSGAEDLA